MSTLVSAATARITGLQADVSGFTAMLRDRPKELPDFVAYMDKTWPHLQVVWGGWG